MTVYCKFTVDLRMKEF